MRLRLTETSLEAAARIRMKHGIILNDEKRKSLPRRVFDEMWGDDLNRDG